MTFASTESNWGPLKDGTGPCINLPSDEVKQNELAENATVERDRELSLKGLDCIRLYGPEHCQMHHIVKELWKQNEPLNHTSQFVQTGNRNQILYQTQISSDICSLNGWKQQHNHEMHCLQTGFKPQPCGLKSD